MNTPPNAKGSIYAEYKFLYVDVGRNGRFSDSGVFNRCYLVYSGLSVSTRF